MTPLALGQQPSAHGPPPLAHCPPTFALAIHPRPFTLALCPRLFAPGSSPPLSPAPSPLALCPWPFAPGPFLPGALPPTLCPRPFTLSLPLDPGPSTPALCPRPLAPGSLQQTPHCQPSEFFRGHFLRQNSPACWRLPMLLGCMHPLSAFGHRRWGVVRPVGKTSNFCHKAPRSLPA